MPEPIEFYPECHLDTALMRALLIDQQKLVVHIHGVPKVGDALHKQAEYYGNSRIVVGMVDKDKGLFDITKLKPFTRIVQQCDEPGSVFVIYQHEQLSNHYLIVLKPASESWIYGAAQAAGLNPMTYGLPATLPEVLALPKKLREDTPGIVALLKAIRRNPPPAYQQLADFVDERLSEVGKQMYR